MRLRRVFALVPDCHVTGWRYGPVWRRHFYEGLQGAGIEVILPQGVNFDWARSGLAVDGRGQAERRATSLQLSRQIVILRSSMGLDGTSRLRRQDRNRRPGFRAGSDSRDFDQSFRTPMGSPKSSIDRSSR